MEVTPKSLAKAIESTFSCHAGVSGDFVVFYLHDGFFQAEVAIQIEDVVSNHPGKPSYQKVAIWMWFRSENSAPIDLSICTFPEVLALCYCLQDKLV
jgi:hypothetical protein